MKKQTTRLLQLRQGDVQIQQVAKLPEGCVEIKPEGRRIVLASLHYRDWRDYAPAAES